MKTKTFITLIILIPILYNVLFADENNDAFMSSIISYQPVLDEWKFPGKYNPANAFDGDFDTVYAGKNNCIDLYLNFNQFIDVDEIHFRNKTIDQKPINYKKIRSNNCSIYLCVNEKIIGKEEFVLKVQNDFQVVKLSKKYKINSLYIFSTINKKEINDFITCIPEIEFYNNSEKIKLSNVVNIKKQYLERITDLLYKAFIDREYIKEDEQNIIIKFSSTGQINYSDKEDATQSSTISKFLPNFWIIKDSKLYLCDDKTDCNLFRYEIEVVGFKKHETIISLIIYRDSSDENTAISMLEKNEYENYNKALDNIYKFKNR